jgi:ABC-2 type transport system ATP-binding protein
MAETRVIQTRDLTKTYKGVMALGALNLEVSPNSIFGFLGPNGAGKTTTIKLLLGLIRPTRGGGTVFGMDILRESFYEHMTARETLDFTARFFFTGPDLEIAKRVDEMLELVDLADKADRPISGFSGGERQRLGIAQAQVNYPDLLILDEPAASLDPLGRRDVLDVMERLRKHCTIFYSTHILDDVQKVSDTVAKNNKCRFVTSGPIEALLAGSGGPVYTVAFKGSEERARSRVAAQDWIADIQTRVHNDQIQWTVSVTDEAAAETRLLRLLLEDEALVVTHFQRRQYELEDVFVDIVEGGRHGGQ